MGVRGRLVWLLPPLPAGNVKTGEAVGRGRGVRRTGVAAAAAAGGEGVLGVVSWEVVLCCACGVTWARVVATVVRGLRNVPTPPRAGS